MLEPRGETPGRKTKKRPWRQGPPPGHRSPPWISYPTLLRAREALACHNLRTSGKMRWLISRQVPHLIQWRLFLITMVKCNDNNIQWDVKDSHRAVQRSHHLNSKTGDPIETSAKGEISRPEAYEKPHWHRWKRQTTRPTLARHDQVLVKVCNLATRWEISS